ncbi:Tubulin polyglutamylase ttll6 [Rhizophlyctis rosea]|nr:Tubulin polyglutamylase ttll6 [Rhizophlyctis rosea]
MGFKINHFPGMHEICRKSRLALNLRRLGRLFPKDYTFLPSTWILPYELADFKRACKEARNKDKKRGQWFIVKPESGCQGKGIFLAKGPENVENIMMSGVARAYNTNSSLGESGPSTTTTPSTTHQPHTGTSSFAPPSTTPRTQPVIVQRYLPRPYLLPHHPFKFDLRIYVLVTSVNPLRIFMYKEGLARFATEPYREPSEGNREEVRMHLTNYAINKGSEKFDWDDVGGGSKRRISDVFGVIESVRGRSVGQVLWRRIGDVIVKTLVTVQPQLSRVLGACSRTAKRGAGLEDTIDDDSATSSSVPPTSPCFEILGFDILLDHKLKPWLLEVNHSPSFTCDSPIDLEIKSGVIGDALGLLKLEAGARLAFEESERQRARGRLVGRDEAVKWTGEEGGDREASLERGRRGEESDRSAKHAVSPSDPQTLSNSSSSKPVSLHLSYAPGFSSQYLAKLTAHEDANLGNYTRIFPPSCPPPTTPSAPPTLTTSASTPKEPTTLLTHYLHLLQTASTLFTSTTTTKARAAHLQKKQQDESERIRRAELRRAREKERRRVAAQRIMEEGRRDRIGASARREEAERRRKIREEESGRCKSVLPMKTGYINDWFDDRVGVCVPLPGGVSVAAAAAAQQQRLYIPNGCHTSSSSSSPAGSMWNLASSSSASLSASSSSLSSGSSSELTSSGAASMASFTPWLQPPVLPKPVVVRKGYQRVDGAKRAEAEREREREKEVGRVSSARSRRIRELCVGGRDDKGSGRGGEGGGHW